MHRIEHRRPGCLLLALFFVVASFVAAYPSGLVWSVSSGWGYATFGVLVVVLMWGQVRVLRATTRRWVPLCPHCGVVADATFRVCRACGRVKEV